MVLPIRKPFPLALQRCTNILHLYNRLLIQLNQTRNFTNEVTIELGDIYKTWQLSTRPDSIITLNKQQAMKLYGNMARIRLLEMILHKLYMKASSSKNIWRPQVGQEAIAVGMNAVLRPKDCIVTDYRCHGWSMLRGLHDLDILTELTRTTKIFKNLSLDNSKQEPQKEDEQMEEEAQVSSESGIVGAQLSLGTSIALACKFKADNSVCVTLHEESATNQMRQILAIYNMAYLWKLPAIYVYEHSECDFATDAVAVADADQSCEKNEYYKGAHPLPGIYVNGMDVLAVCNATAFAMDYVQKYGPIVMEAHTKRNFNHTFETDSSNDETKVDPIAKFKQLCTTHGLVSEAELELINQNLHAELYGVANEFLNTKQTQSTNEWINMFQGEKNSGIHVATEVKQNHFRVGHIDEPMHADPEITKKGTMLENSKKLTEEMDHLEYDETNYKTENI